MVDRSDIGYALTIIAEPVRMAENVDLTIDAHSATSSVMEPTIAIGWHQKEIAMQQHQHVVLLWDHIKLN